MSILKQLDQSIPIIDIIISILESISSKTGKRIDKKFNITDYKHIIKLVHQYIQRSDDLSILNSNSINVPRGSRVLWRTGLVGLPINMSVRSEIDEMEDASMVKQMKIKNVCR